MPDVTLGRDCSITANGGVLTTARRVSFSRSATEIECALRGSSHFSFFPGPETVTLEVEVVGVGDAAALAAAMSSGSLVTVSATNGSGAYRVFNLTADEPLDGVVTYTATLKRSIE